MHIIPNRSVDVDGSQEISCLCAGMPALAEQAIEPNVQRSLIDLSHIWMEAALNEERHILDERAPKKAVTK